MGSHGRAERVAQRRRQRDLDPPALRLVPEERVKLREGPAGARADLEQHLVGTAAAQRRHQLARAGGHALATEQRQQ